MPSPFTSALSGQNGLGFCIIMKLTIEITSSMLTIPSQLASPGKTADVKVVADAVIPVE